MYVHISTCICTCTNACIYVLAQLCVLVDVHNCTCICVYAIICVWAHTSTTTHAYAHSQLYMHKWMNYCTCLLASKISCANFLFWILASVFSLKLSLSSISPWTCSHGILASSLLVSRFETQAFSLALLPFDFWMWVFDLYLLSMDF